MIEVTLRKILDRRKPAEPVIRGLLESIDGNMRVEDAEGRLLLGAAALNPTQGDGFARRPVMVEGGILGYVCGSEASAEPVAATVAATLAWVAAREAEMKQLGAEVLNCYREINLIHRFSEKLAKLLDTASVAEASVAQACQMVKASLGAVLLLNDRSGIFEPIASLPHQAEFKSGILGGEGLLGAIAARGNAEIVNDVAADPRRSDQDPALSSVICVPLNMRERIRGLLVIGSAEPVTYTAGDLKLMTTLGLQTATAIENAILYEKTLAAARAEALEQTLLEVEEQKRKAEAMLLNILPASVAMELQQDGVVQPMYFEDVTVCFTDFVGFSKSTMTMAAEDVVQELNKYFTAFDRIVERYGLEKLKTIGDSYMFVSGLPKRRPANPIDAVLAAMEMVETVRSMTSSESGAGWKVRVGLHTGPVIAGVVGIHKFAFDIWGETVNLASRMESCGESDRVNISERTFARVKDFITLEPRGRIKTKEGQDIEMYFVKGVPEGLLMDRSACPPPLFDRRYRLYFKERTPSFPAYLLAPPSA
jgi:class 3 adenylate cyclase/putative methionine-R-sulfoxide reductase with GAF domain